MLNTTIKKEDIGYLRLLIDLAKLQFAVKINESKETQVGMQNINIQVIKATA